MKTANFVVLVLVAACGEALAQERPPTFLTHEELKAFFSESRTIRIISEQYRRSSTTTYQKDGTAIVDVDNTGYRMVGTWRIDGDQFCTKYTQVGSGCYKIQKTGVDSYKTFSAEKGTVGGTWEVKK